MFQKHHAGHKKAKAAQETVEEEVTDAKEALDKLTYTKEEQVMNVPEEGEEKETGYHNTINSKYGVDLDGWEEGKRGGGDFQR